MNSFTDFVSSTHFHLVLINLLFWLNRLCFVMFPEDFFFSSMLAIMCGYFTSMLYLYLYLDKATCRCVAIVLSAKESQKATLWTWKRKRTKYIVPQVDKGTSLHCYYVKMCRTGEYACDTCSTHFYIIAVKGCSFVYLRNCTFCLLSLSCS